MEKEQKILRLILGDQLNEAHSWFKKTDNRVYYLLMEIRSETDYAPHHIQKVSAIFMAMRQFVEKLKQEKHQVIYLKINDKNNLQAFDKNLSSLIEKENFTHFEYQLPDEYRVDQILKKFTENSTITTRVYDTEHFLSSRTELAEFFKGKKMFLMENFYRHMRKKHQIMMEGNDPQGGKWNYDSENRKKLPANHRAPEPLLFDNDALEVLNEIERAGINTIGRITANKLIWPINRLQALEVLTYFVEHLLPLFGTFQDAMTPDSWSLYHARISFALNVKLISPLEVIEKAIKQAEKNPDQITINQLEGFVRQILGWREYMRGIYWLQMPNYANLNYFEHLNDLPEWFWTANTKMHCLRHTINQSLDYAYAHHIQRLMITGNFLLLAGINPHWVDYWYLGIYIDAFEWVEITNTRGMSQFADGGIVGSKPYVSSATYIDKMSNYCQSCYYKKNLKTGPRSCPFNSLYWNFYNKHQDKLAKNPRIGMMYQVWNRMTADDKNALLKQADFYLKNINTL